MSLLDGAESVARAFNVILSDWCAVTSQSQDCRSGIWWSVNNVFLAGITDVCDDQVVDGCTNVWMRIADLFGQRSKTWRVHGDMLQTIHRLSTKVFNRHRLERRSVG